MVKGDKMERSLIEQVKRAAPTMGEFLDIPTGKYVNPNLPTLDELINGISPERLHQVMTYDAVRRPMSGRNTYLLNLLETEIKKTKGGTVERFRLAANLFVALGLQVKWDGTLNPPEVSWFDTEGWSNGLDISGMIHDKLYKDPEPVKDDADRLGEHFYTQLANLKANAKHRVDLTIDSISTEEETVMPAASNNLVIQRDKNTDSL